MALESHVKRSSYEVEWQDGMRSGQLSKDQADYISVNQEGPYKPDAYRY